MVAANSGSVIEQTSAIPSGPLWQFRAFSTQRTQYWLRVLRAESIVDAAHAGGELWRRQTDEGEIRAVISDVFVSEMLTRLWTAVLLAADRYRGTDHAGPIARSVLSNHLTARNAALRILAGDHSLTVAQRDSANRIRQRSERWSDLLVSPLVCRYGLTGIVHQERRVRDFGEDRISQGASDPRSAIWSLTRAGLRAAFPSDGSVSASSCTRYQRGILRSVLATFAVLEVAQNRMERSQRR